MSVAFVVMQIGEPELDQLFENVIRPAVESVGMEAKRVDRDHGGRLLKSEIIGFLDDSEIIIADLTNERPNVYLEVGYAMGLDKFHNLIMTCRSDHIPGEEGWEADGPKIHFDLAGYDIMFWERSEPEVLRHKLAKEIRRRQALLPPATAAENPILDMEWIQTHRETASRGMAEADITTYMEASFGIDAPKPDHGQSDLLKAASDSVIQTFGRPIAIVDWNTDKYRPRPRLDGITAEVSVGSRPLYNYWALRKNGDFYLRTSLFEDQQDPSAIFFNTRIVRNTELLMYALGLYERLGIGPATGFALELTYGGLNGRVLRSTPNYIFLEKHTCTEDRFTTSYEGSLQEVEENLAGVVEQLTAAMLALFDFFEKPSSVYQRIVENYVDGRVT